MVTKARCSHFFLAGLVITWTISMTPLPSLAHPMGNFSISHYAGIRVDQDAVEVQYLIDMAEIPTFQEIQENGIVPQANQPGLREYLARKAEALKEGVLLEINGRPLALEAEPKELIFPPGAGGLPTMKLWVIYRAKLDGPVAVGMSYLRFRDGNFPERAGWKEIVAKEGDGVVFVSSSAPDRDRSLQLSNYPTDLLNSPPQDVEARLAFTFAGPSREQASTALEPIRLQPNKQTTPRNPFTELVATKQLGFGIVVLALAVALGLGALHALEPGHGKTVIAAYLVGSRGTARQALLLGLIVTASHTVGVFLLGAVTLYASRYMVPEHLYPWLGLVSGLTIAGLGFSLFLQRHAGSPQFSSHAHAHEHSHAHGHQPHSHGLEETLGHRHAGHLHPSDGAVSLRELLALGVTGGIIPCPAALVVLLSALSLNRTGFGLFLIVAFSVGLAVVLIGIGLLIVYARHFISRFNGNTQLITRWLPLASSAVITVFGMAIAVEALLRGGFLNFQL